LHKIRWGFPLSSCILRLEKNSGKDRAPETHEANRERPKTGRVSGAGKRQRSETVAKPKRPSLRTPKISRRTPEDFRPVLKIHGFPDLVIVVDAFSRPGLRRLRQPPGPVPREQRKGDNHLWVVHRRTNEKNLVRVRQKEVPKTHLLFSLSSLPICVCVCVCVCVCGGGGGVLLCCAVSDRRQACFVSVWFVLCPL